MPDTTMPGRVFVRKRHDGVGEEVLKVSWLPQTDHESYVLESAVDARERAVFAAGFKQGYMTRWGHDKESVIDVAYRVWKESSNA